MRSVVWATALVAVLAGCAEQVDAPDEAVDDVEPVEGTNTTAEPGSFQVSLAAGNATAGTNITVALGIEAPADLNVSLVSWNLSAGNESLGQGMGLPSELNVTLEAGNHTLRLDATAEGYLPANATLLLQVLEPLPDDPCAGVPVQEPITISGLFAGAAVSGSGTYQGHPFDLGPCQTKVLAEITSSEAYLDPMLRLKDNTGATVDAEDNEFLYHDTLTYEPGGYLEPGTWQIDARGYVGAPGNYEIVLTFE